MVRIECSERYLGNYFQVVDLQHRLDAARAAHQVMEVELTQDDQKKSRIYTATASGISIGLVKKRDWQLMDGDVFRVERDRLLLIHLANQTLMTLSVTHHDAHAALKLIHLGHMLGNHHHPIIVMTDKIYIPMNGNTNTLESTIKGFNIEGLEISYEVRSLHQSLDFPTHHHGV